MRWDALFADLEAQLAEAERRELDLEVADRIRRERALVPLRDRLRDLLGTGAEITITLPVARSLLGRLLDVGPDWLLLEDRDGGEVVLPIGSVLAIRGLGTRAARPAAPHVERRLTLGYALRGIAVDRAPVAVTLVDGTQTTGTIDRVGSDYLDLAEHAPGEPRRAAAVSGVRTVPFAAVLLVRLA